MDLDAAALSVPLNGYVMHLRPSELRSVAAGLAEFDAERRSVGAGLVELGGERRSSNAGMGEFDASPEADWITVADAVRRLPASDRAPLWELAMRRFGRRRSLEQAAGEIGMDVLHARRLLESFSRALAEVAPPENRPSR